jgi:hypothetical protein
MILAVGHGPLADLIRREKLGLVAFPEFFDNKKLLLQGRVREYVRALFKNYKHIRYALYPDYYYKELDLPRSITYVYPVHKLSEADFVKELQRRYTIIPGYASDPGFRDYNITDFMETFKEPKWYLGISTWRELREAILFNFDYGDITGFLLGKFSQIKDRKYVRARVTELLKYVNSPYKQTSLLDFWRSPGGKHAFL